MIKSLAVENLNGDGLLDFISFGITRSKMLINRGDEYADAYQTSFF